MPPQIAIGAILAAGATVAASAAFTAGGFLLFSKAAAIFFAKRFLLVATVGYIIQKSAKRPSKPNVGSAVSGATQLRQDSVIPKRWILGRSRVTGAYIWHRHLDSRLAMVFILGAGPMDSIERIWVDGEEVEIQTDAATGVITPAAGSRFNSTRVRTRTETYTEIIYVGPEEGGGRDRDGSDPGSRSSGGGGGSGGGWGSDTSFASDIGDDPSTRGGDLPADGGVPASRGGRSAPPNIPQPQRVGGGGEGGGRDRGPGRYNALQPGYKRVTRTRTITSEYEVPNITITPYFKADGMEGQRIREIAAERLPDDSATQATTDNNLAWTTEHKLNDISYVLVEFQQPPHENTSEGVQGRFYNRLPVVEFQVKGLKVSYPTAAADTEGNVTMTEPAWTDNAAILRYWYLTERRDVNPSRIDYTYFNSARMKCDEMLMLSEHAEYQSDHPETVRRYTINGVVNSGDSAQALERQFDMCWQGEAVQWNGGFLFRPGMELTPSLVISEDDVIGEPVVRPTLPRERRTNEVSIELEQSARADFRRAEYRIDDFEKQTADNERLPTDIGTQSFIQEPVQAINIIYQALRAQAASMQVDVRVHPGGDFRYVGLKPGDKVELQLSDYGIGQGPRPAPGSDAAATEVRFFRVASNSVNADLSVDLQLTQWPDGWYEDRFEFPAIRPRTLNIAAPVLPPVASPVAITHAIGQDGGFTWEAVLYFEPTHNRTVCWVDSPLTNRQEQDARLGEAHFRLTSPGTYTFYAYNVTDDGRASSVISATAVASYLDIPLPQSMLLSALPLGRDLQIQIQNIPVRDIAGAEVKYTTGNLDADLTSLPAITEDGWDTALEMNVTTTLPRSSAQPIFANAVFPTSGAFRVFMRLVSRVDTLSPIVEIGQFRYEIIGGDASNRNSSPSWSGMPENMAVWTNDDASRLLPDRRNRDAVKFTEWDGVPDWPFGSNDGLGAAYVDDGDANTAYTTQVYSLGDTAASREITVTVETAAPSGVTNDVSDVEITLLHSTGANLASPTAVSMTNGGRTTEHARSIAVRVHLRTTRSNALTSLNVGWRDLTG